MRYIMLMQTLVGGVQPAYAPQGLEDHYEDYGAFLFETEEEARAEIADDLDFRRIEGLFDDDNYWIEPCSVQADGSIYLPAHEKSLPREKIYRDFGMDLPGASLQDESPSP